MKRLFVFHAGFVLSGLLLAGVVEAQQTPACPVLPADAGLTWDSRDSGNTQLCRALRGDGTEAFGLVISPKPTFEPQRADRKERGQIDGHEVYWYLAELAQKPGVQARETVLQLRDGRSAHLWLQADSEAQLAGGFQLLQDLHFSPDTRGQQVAGQ